MFDPLILAPVAVGAMLIAGLLLELGLGKIGFLSKGLGITYDKLQKRYNLSAGPVVGVFLIGAVLVIAPLLIDYFLVSKRAFFVSGTVQVEDRNDATGTRIITCYPLAQVEPDGYFEEVKIFKDEKGRFPRLAFELDGYYTPPVSFMEFPALKLGSQIRLRKTVVLKPKPDQND